MTRKLRGTLLTRILLFLLLSTVLSGCGEDKKMEVIHSCQVFEEAEIRELVDSSIDWPPKETHREDAENGYWMSMCNYFSTETGLSASMMIQPFFPHSISAEEALQNYRASIRESLPDYEMKEIDAAGSPGLWNPEMGQLALFADQHMLLVTAGRKGMEEEAKLSLCRKLTEAVLAKNILKE